MGFMRLGSNESRLTAVGHEFLKVGSYFGEQVGGHARGHRDDASKDTRQETMQMTEGDRAIDAPRRIGRKVSLGGQISGQGVEIVADHLGAAVLAGGQPGEARGVLEAQPMFDALERGV